MLAALVVLGILVVGLLVPPVLLALLLRVVARPCLAPMKMKTVIVELPLRPIAGSRVTVRASGSARGAA